MKIEQLFIYCLLAGASLLASCSGEDVMDNQVEPLPEGMYPLTFTATQGEVVTSPQTRVSDYDDTDGKHKSKWDNSDQIKVTVSKPGYSASTICTLDENGNITGYDPQLYWQTTGNYTINAWYSNIAGQSPTATNTVTLADQSKGLAYVLKADQLTDKNYKSGNIALAFKHQLAKVRVALGDGSTADLFNDDAKVEVYNYPSCTVSNGTINISNPPQADYITMRKVTYGDKKYYEANVIPNGTVSKFRITLKDKTAKEVTIGSSVALAAAKLHLITLTVTNAKITLGNNPININDNGEYTISGTGTQPITINGSPTVTFDGLEITNGKTAAIDIQSGSPVFVLNGNNTIKQPEGDRTTVIQLSGENTNLTIRGNGTLQLISTSPPQYSSESTLIGSPKGGKCGNIIIEGCTITAETRSAAAIGAAMGGTCGDITIRNAKITAKGSPAIGASQIGYNGYKGICGNILIENTDLTASINRGYGNNSVAIGAGSIDVDNASTTCGTITITHTTKTRATILTTITGDDLKIGKGVVTHSGSSNSCGLITITGSDGMQQYSGDSGVANN